MREIGDQIKEIRKARGKSQSSFANELGVSVKHINLIENSKAYP